MAEFAQGGPYNHAHGNRDIHPGVTGENLAPRQTVEQWPKSVFDKESDKKADHARADDSHIVQHLT